MNATSSCLSLPKHLTFCTLYIHADGVWNIQIFICVRYTWCGVVGHDTTDSGKWVPVLQRNVLLIPFLLILNPEDGHCRILFKG